MQEKRTWIITGGIFGFLGVALGAFGAHGLKDILSAEMIEIYKTGVFYQLVHSVVILAVAFGGEAKYFKAAMFFAIGIVLFSFSLYLYSVTQVLAFAIITPFGGVSFLIGWLLLIISAAKNPHRVQREI